MDNKKEENHAGPRAKEQAREKLLQLIDQIENVSVEKKEMIIMGDAKSK